MKVQLWVIVALLSGACSPAAQHSEQERGLEQPAGTAGSQPAAQPAPRNDVARPEASARVPDNVRKDAAEADAQRVQRNHEGINDSAATLKDFNDRIEIYMDARGKAKGDAPALKETDDPAKIKAAQQALAAAIRRERATAKPGDIFTPSIRTRFRQLMYPELKGEDGRDARAIIKDDAPASVSLKVNGDYVSDMKPTVPSNVLANLPMLPKELEYRIVNKDLILMDADANLIVDFIPNAIQ